ncbi:MAG: glycine oxidase [Flavobacteriaceae bacterium]|jgi:glycine oxidase|tara:strand:- start:10370 stop:11437 length:1068 start_codon:yes stop_codon:yes gene_type:complete
MKHSIIVGLGLAGFHYARKLKKNKKDFLIIDQGDKAASRNAAGVCNPTVLKRYTMAWEGSQFFDYAISSYKEYEAETKQQFFHSLPIHRYFFSPSEQNQWSVAAQSSTLSRFLDPNFRSESSIGLKDQNGYGTVKEVGRLAINELLDVFIDSLLPSELLEQVFDPSELEIFSNKVVYKGIEASQIVFCEGYGLKTNQWFNYLPLVGSKGEYLKIKAPLLSRKNIIKGSVFITPIKENEFWVGATFAPHDKTTLPTENAKQWLLSKLEALIEVPFQVIDHGAQIRPTVIDRRPLLGNHPTHKNLNVFNGLGTRGVMMAPLLSEWLYDFIELKKQLPEAVAINRFESYFSNPKKQHV